jgi:hypothetical protein
MSESALNAAGPELAVQIHLQQIHDAAVAQAASISAATVANAAQKLASQHLAAQAQLTDMLDGEAPDDASMGLYSENIFATEVAANASRQQLLVQDEESAAAAAVALTVEQADQQMPGGAASNGLGAVAAIDQRLDSGLIEARLTAFASDLGDLFQAVEHSQASPANPLPLASVSASPPETALAEPVAPNLAAIAASNLAAQIQNLAAAAQSGDLAAATALTRTISAQLQTMSPNVLQLLAPPPPAAAPSLVDLVTNPLLLIFQASLLLDVKTTLNKARKPLDDHIAILPFLALGEMHDDGSKDE